MLQRIRWLPLSLLMLPCVVPAGQRQPPETVPWLDLGRYLGTWYEVARLPNRFQRQCSGNVSADYRQLADGTLEVINRCRDRHGDMDEARGVARITDVSTNAKLEVSFVSVFGWNLFWGDYWVLGLGQDYEYAVVGTPGRRYGWILSRTRQLPEATWRAVRRDLVRAGYDPERFIQTRHGSAATD